MPLRRVLAVLMLAIAGTLLAASTSAPTDEPVGVIEPIPPLEASDGGH